MPRGAAPRSHRGWGWPRPPRRLGPRVRGARLPRGGPGPAPRAWRFRGAGRGAGAARAGTPAPSHGGGLPPSLPPSFPPAFAPLLPPSLPLLPLGARGRPRPAMSAAKHRGPKGGSPPAVAAANERGAQPGGSEEAAAKKPAAAASHGRGGRSGAGGGGGRSAAGPRRGWALLLGAAVVLGAALPAGWYVRQLREEVGRSAREREASGRQRQELAATLDAVVQKVAGAAGEGSAPRGGRRACGKGVRRRVASVRMLSWCWKGWPRGLPRSPPRWARSVRSHFM